MKKKKKTITLGAVEFICPHTGKRCEMDATLRIRYRPEVVVTVQEGLPVVNPGNWQLPPQERAEDDSDG